MSSESWLTFNADFRKTFPEISLSTRAASTVIRVANWRQQYFAIMASNAAYIISRQDDAETRLAMMALVACPTGSIGTTEKHDAHIGIDAFPSLIAENVYFCGFTSESSFGGWSYLIVRPESEGGNVLVDSPRFTRHLVRRFHETGRHHADAAHAS